MKKVWERMVPISKIDRRWDIDFWQSQSSNARFNTTWRMLEDFYRIKGKKPNAATLRLQRNIEHIKQAHKGR